MQADHPASTEEERSSARTWGIITGIAAAFFLWGMLIFFVIGDKGPPDWDFSVIPDVPGESAYSTHSPYRPHGLTSAPSVVDPQHVMERGPDRKEGAPK